MTVHTPADEADIAALVTEAAARGTALDIVGGNTRSGLGRPREGTEQLALSRLGGVTLYEPAELVIGARAGTPLAEIEALIGQRGQMLPFEPMDHRRLYGTGGAPSIGALAACNISGPRRLSAGAARDALIGVRLVNGRGQAIASGGRVMKNVTGLDLVKLNAGAHGTLGVLTEVIFKLLPKPETAETLVFAGLDDARALKLMTSATGTPHDVSAAAHIPPIRGEVARTALRLEGLEHSVRHRARALREALMAFGGAELIGADATAALWAQIRDVGPLVSETGAEIWRVSVAAGKAARLLPWLERTSGLTYYFDWAGGLVWIASAGDVAATLRAEVAALGGHATLVRAAQERRRSIPVFQPPGAPVMTLTSGIKHSFDPAGLFNRGRMYEGI